MYQIDLKGYFEKSLCATKSLDYNSVAANSKYDCSSKCDSDATCAAFVYADSKCSKRLYSDLDRNGGSTELCHLAKYLELTGSMFANGHFSEDNCKAYCDDEANICKAYSYSGGKCVLETTTTEFTNDL